MSFKEENCKAGKTSKQILTVLLCSNNTGTNTLKPLVAEKFAKPKRFENVRSLPVEYKGNKKVWMTEEILNNW